MPSMGNEAELRPICANCDCPIYLADGVAEWRHIGTLVRPCDLPPRLATRATPSPVVVEEAARQAFRQFLHRARHSQGRGWPTRDEVIAMFDAEFASTPAQGWQAIERDEIQRLREALTEIAGEELSGESNPNVADDSPVHSFCVTFGMLRRARAALAPRKEAAPEKQTK